MRGNDRECEPRQTFISERCRQRPRHEGIVQRQKRSGKPADLDAILMLRLSRLRYIGCVYDHLVPGSSQLPAQSLDMELYAADVGVERCDLQDSQITPAGLQRAPAVSTRGAYEFTAHPSGAGRGQATVQIKSLPPYDENLVGDGAIEGVWKIYDEKVDTVNSARCE